MCVFLINRRTGMDWHSQFQNNTTLGFWNVMWWMQIPECVVYHKISFFLRLVLPGQAYGRRREMLPGLLSLMALFTATWLEQYPCFYCNVLLHTYLGNKLSAWNDMVVLNTSSWCFMNTTSDFHCRPNSTRCFEWHTGDVLVLVHVLPCWFRSQIPARKEQSQVTLYNPVSFLQDYFSRYKGLWKGLEWVDWSLLSWMLLTCLCWQKTSPSCLKEREREREKEERGKERER